MQAKAYDIEDCEVGVVNVSVSTALTGAGAPAERETEEILQRLLTAAIRLEVRRSGVSTGANVVQCDESRGEWLLVLRVSVPHTPAAQDYPRNEIAVVVQVVNDSGSLLSVVTNAICLALLDSGVTMRYVFAAHCCGLVSSSSSSGSGSTGAGAAVGSSESGAVREDVMLDLALAEQQVVCPLICWGCHALASCPTLVSAVCV